MRRIHVGFFAAVLCAAGVAWAASNNKTVTNGPPVANISMELAPSTDGQGCFVWEVTGKMKPSYRGWGSSIQLVCQPYNLIGSGQGLVAYPNGCERDGPCAAQADACGNFNFQIHVCGTTPQLDQTNYCTFIAHVDQAHQPSACSSKQIRGDVPEDPSGSAPCSGGFCPDAP
jgi:hypothetical protein